MLEQGIRSMISAPLVFGDTVDACSRFQQARARRIHRSRRADRRRDCRSGVVSAPAPASARNASVAAAEQHSRRLRTPSGALRGALAGHTGSTASGGRFSRSSRGLDQAAWSPGRIHRPAHRRKAGLGKNCRSCHPLCEPTCRGSGSWRSICARLPETLRSPNSFGHERGAFTGADRLKRVASSWPPRHALPR